MTEKDDHPQGPRDDQAEEEAAVPPRRRVIGTPPPAASRRLLGNGAPVEAAPERELPAENPEPRRARRAERVVALFFLISFLGSAAFIASYVIFQVHTVDKAFRSNLALGLTMTVAFLALAAGTVVWVRNLMPHVELTEERHPLTSSEEDREAFARTFTEGAEASQFVRRPIVRRSLLTALIPLTLAPLVLLRDLGPLPRKKLRHTAWRKGSRLVVLGTNAPIRPADFATPGALITVVPEGTSDNLESVAKAATIIIKFRPGELKHPTVMNWTVDGIVAYSKICTHVGCPAALYEHTTHHILCPCHQSTFDAQRGAKVIFGPAPRPLPQLPITVDSEGYLVAQSDFKVPVGPSFWEMG
ncbi:MAG: Rieske 2Fe-2S domain-containing protein [Micromonosporaceae bacterium]